MGFRNNKLGYPNELLVSRAVIKKDNFALIPLGGLVKNVIPGFENCDITILSSTKLGASFVDYYMTMLKGGKSTKGFGGNGVEVFAYVLSGKVKATVGSDDFDLMEGSYIYCPPDKQIHFENLQDHNSELFLYKRRYKEAEGCKPYTFSKNIKDVEIITFEDMNDVEFCNLLPTDINFDMNFHILTFKQGASHGYLETHVQEHGAFILSGEGMYNLDNNWMPVEKGDYIFMDSYSLQAAYSVGRNENFSYLYSKDCNRDEDI